MKKKGFTLVELLVVIVILGLLITFGVIAYVRIQKSANERLYESKISAIEIAAYKYGEEYKDDVFLRPEEYVNIPISRLITYGYITSDYEIKNALKNPVTKEEMTETITIKYENLKIAVTINKTN